MLLIIAKHLSQRGKNVGNILDIGTVIIFFLIPFVLINLQPDFGTSSSLLALFIGTLFWSGADVYYMFFLFSVLVMFFASLISETLSMLAGFIISIILFFFRKKIYVFISSILIIVGIGLVSSKIYDLLPLHQKGRIEVFLEPGKDPLGTGYNVLQAMLAVGSGGIIGKGFGEGSITQLKYVPMQWTDFIFSVPAEEFGLIGSTIILLLLLSLVYRIINIAGRTKDVFSSILCFGIAMNFLFHIIVNIGMVLGVSPAMGIPLPFLSYGGSYLTTNLVSIGIVMNVNKITTKQHNIFQN